ncbi:ADP-L-glycero-D-manno-heptose-6-epimerase [Siccirubricoccus deserti]|uniref:ADP-L-glycero-D-manno-heptose-6-epimerase n=1 Tax=Siccirubricoccus deserti TaxID=2013562 RepID=A0A9X0QU91_9PROT|nr:ADP-glyceromanno-heptose 6-epimerase [Siccirubricoccus deserti]MBC4013790.1 ADP-glyceromanno-heptose 6-epimerase [Siccirubricoccus deserti]GGC29486.1 ADP-L-glycero-D-manno-heptose-6-epimerase [Siccirubricoccus deserti]
MYLVTGGAGFIGSHLVAALASRGAEVMVVDRLGHGEKWRNLAAPTIAGLLPPEELEDFWSAAPPITAVLHMGAISATTETDGDLVAATNLTLPLWLWNACAEREVPFVYASSAATYGDGSQGFSDDASPEALARLRPLNLYGWSKLAFDRRVAQLLERGAAAPPQWAGLRFFNVYGAHEAHKGRMASVLFHKYRQVMQGEAATLFRSDRPGIADGEQQRDFVHVDDCVAVMLWLLDNPQVSGLFNLGSGRARSFLDLVRAMFAALGRAEEIRFIDMPDDLKGKYQYFTEAPLETLRTAGFAGQMTPLEEGVRRTIAQYQALDAAR